MLYAADNVRIFRKASCAFDDDDASDCSTLGFEKKSLPFPISCGARGSGAADPLTMSAGDHIRIADSTWALAAYSIWSERANRLGHFRLMSQLFPVRPRFP